MSDINEATQQDIDVRRAEIREIRAAIPHMTREEWDAAEQRIRQLHVEALQIEERLPA